LSRKTPEQWGQIREEFAAGASISALAKSFEVSRTTITRRAKRDNWKVTGGASPAGTKFTVAAPLKLFDGPPIIAEGKALVLRMLDELEAVTSHQGELAELIEFETATDRDDRRRSAMMRAITLGSRAVALKNLAAAAKTLAEMGSVGKKDLAQEAAKNAGEDTDWGDDLIPAVRLN
jgi:hypothetical protein